MLSNNGRLNPGRNQQTLICEVHILKVMVLPSLFAAEMFSVILLQVCFWAENNGTGFKNLVLMMHECDFMYSGRLELNSHSGEVMVLYKKLLSLPPSLSLSFPPSLPPFLSLLQYSALCHLLQILSFPHPASPKSSRAVAKSHWYVACLSPLPRGHGGCQPRHCSNQTGDSLYHMN